MIGKGDLVPQVEYAYAESMIKTGQIGSGMERPGAGEAASGDRCIAHWEKRWAVKETINVRLTNSALRFSSVHGMPVHITISARWNSKAATQRRQFRNLRFGAAVAGQRGIPPGTGNAYTAALRPADAQKEMETYILRQRARSACSRLRLPLPSNSQHHQWRYDQGVLAGRILSARYNPLTLEQEVELVRCQIAQLLNLP